MSISTKPASKPTSVRNDSTPSQSTTSSGRTQGQPGLRAGKPGQQFVIMALNMSWQLAIVILAPVLGGVALGNAMGAKTVWVLTGVVLAFVGSGVVMWHTMQVANRLPVPKLSDAERRKIQKSYEEDDEE